MNKYAQNGKIKTVVSAMKEKNGYCEDINGG